MASKFPTTYVRVASQTYVLQHIIEYLKTFEISNEDLCLCQVFAMLFVELPPCSITMLCCYHVWINLWPATRDKCLASGGSITMYNNVLQRTLHPLYEEISTLQQ